MIPPIQSLVGVDNHVISLKLVVRSLGVAHPKRVRDTSSTVQFGLDTLVGGSETQEGTSTRFLSQRVANGESLGFVHAHALLFGDGLGKVVSNVGGHVGLDNEISTDRHVDADVHAVGDGLGVGGAKRSSGRDTARDGERTGGVAAAVLGRSHDGLVAGFSEGASGIHSLATCAIPFALSLTTLQGSLQSSTLLALGMLSPRITLLRGRLVLLALPKSSIAHVQHLAVILSTAERAADICYSLMIP